MPSPGTPKYVFQGLSDFTINPPEIITGDNYESGRGIRSADLFGETGVHINIFNISKINAEVRGDKEPRIKRLQEYIGESYFEYLSKLDDRTTCQASLVATATEVRNERREQTAALGRIQSFEPSRPAARVAGSFA